MGELKTASEVRFAALYESHYAAVSAYVRRRCPPAQVEDVIHETFIVAWRRFESIPSEPLPWLLGVARRTLANDARGRARREALLQRLAAAEAPAPAGTESLGSREISPRVRDALAGLSEPALEALLLTAWEELSPRDAAKVLGCGPATFRARLYRARRALSTALAPRTRPSEGTSEDEAIRAAGFARVIAEARARDGAPRTGATPLAVGAAGRRARSARWARRAALVAIPLALVALLVVSSLGSRRSGVAQAAVIAAQAAAALEKPNTIMHVRATVYSAGEMCIGYEIPPRCIGRRTESSSGISTNPANDTVAYTYEEWSGSGGEREHTIYGTGDQTAATGNSTSRYDPADETLTTVTGTGRDSAPRAELEPDSIPALEGLTVSGIEALYKMAEDGGEDVELIGEPKIDGEPTDELEVVPPIASPSHPLTATECNRGKCGEVVCTSASCETAPTPSLLLYVDSKTYLPVRAVVELRNANEAAASPWPARRAMLNVVIDLNAETLPATPANESLLEISEPGAKHVVWSEAERAAAAKKAIRPSFAREREGSSAKRR